MARQLLSFFVPFHVVRLNSTFPQLTSTPTITSSHAHHCHLLECVFILTLNSATPSKPANAITFQIASSSKRSTGKKNTKDYIATKNGGGDSVTALGLRPESAAQSVVGRLDRVGREMAESLSQLEPSGSQ
ncbi:hypothetical protein PG987_012045 [Apiospora arundinis]